MVAIKLSDKLHVRSLTTARTCTGELEERRCELAVLNVCLDVNKVFLRLNVLCEVIPVSLLNELTLLMLH